MNTYYYASQVYMYGHCKPIFDITGGTFVVSRFVNKIQIKKAIQEKYSVTVEKVRTQIYGPERSTKYTKKGIQNTKSKIIKKAIVQLAEGDTIDFYSNL